MEEEDTVKRARFLRGPASRHAGLIAHLLRCKEPAQQLLPDMVGAHRIQHLGGEQRLGRRTRAEPIILEPEGAADTLVAELRQRMVVDLQLEEEEALPTRLYCKTLVGSQLCVRP